MNWKEKNMGKLGGSKKITLTLMGKNVSYENCKRKKKQTNKMIPLSGSKSWVGEKFDVTCLRSRVVNIW